jgi:ankyrin repeat protein
MSGFGRRVMLAGLGATLAMEGTGMAEAETGLDPKAEGPDGLPIIFWTIKQGDAAKVNALLDAGADLEAAGYHGATPVLSAAVVDDWVMVAMLIQRGANPAVVDRRGFSIPWLTSQAKVAKGSPTEASLNAVRKYLNDRAMLERVYDPAQVRELMKAGKWPPG